MRIMIQITIKSNPLFFGPCPTPPKYSKPVRSCFYYLVEKAEKNTDIVFPAYIMLVSQMTPGFAYQSINQSINPGFLKWPK